ncbi:MAG: bifunctional diaminohydroxyphosphoribosylaminopyrimidine deaminase/5-amino-6-(5-phosphoribosylamino)uracil reductase RibD [Bacteroidetes bacterium]|nr:bifunctional diaminohydroxyphosphoribosylaminopyrimidine deaminase/5-amino-6-(5-phosphoribosylamino)uracil reductase RibD [Bacteroidota bacterium]
MNTHDSYMKHCLELATKGLGCVAPNPLVGCVLVKDGKIIGEGFHEKYGEAHAEVNAINSVINKEHLKHCTLYVNLEPCAHQGKTPPCVDLIIAHKIPYVVVGCLDSNPLVNSKGVAKLIQNGIDVKIGVLDKECRNLNKRFFTFQEKKRPYIILKWAESNDGFVAPINNKEISWITGEDSRNLVHQWRSQEQAILIGTNTAIIDNPQLTVRNYKGNNPIRILIDKNLRTPLSHRIFEQTAQILVFTNYKQASYNKVEYCTIDFEKNIIPQVMEELYKRNITSVLVEGGAFTLNSFIASNLWDEAKVFKGTIDFKEGVTAPKLTSNFKQNYSLTIGYDLLTAYTNYGI